MRMDTSFHLVLQEGKKDLSQVFLICYQRHEKKFTQIHIQYVTDPRKGGLTRSVEMLW